MKGKMEKFQELSVLVLIVFIAHHGEKKKKKKENPGLISFRMGWLDLLAVQGTLKSLLQHHSSMHDTGCLGLVHWTTQRDGMGREEGGGFRMGNTCIPVADSF